MKPKIMEKIRKNKMTTKKFTDSECSLVLLDLQTGKMKPKIMEEVLKSLSLNVSLRLTVNFFGPISAEIGLKIFWFEFL